MLSISRSSRCHPVCTVSPRASPANDWVSHAPARRAAATAALDATFPAVEMHLLYPELEAEGLSPHKVNYVYISNPTLEPNYYVETSDTIDIKVAALREHKSQLGDWDPDEPIKAWNRETGKKVGFEFGERFLRITLKEPEIESEAGSANE